MIKFALVGCGRIAKRHSELLGLGQIAGARLVAVCDLVPHKAQAIAERFLVPAYTDMHQMLVDQKIDVVVVLTESGNHAKNVVALAPYGKHIIVEKPMALLLEDADNMIEACAKYGCKLFVIKQNRFNVPVVKTRAALDEGRFGRLTIGTVRVRWCRPQSYYDQDRWRGTWAMDGGVLTNQASHHVDLLQWMMGDVESVVAKSSRVLARIEAEDTAAAVLKFKSGALGVIEATTAARPTDLEGSISLLGEGGTVEIGGFAVNKMKIWNFAQSSPDDDEVLAKYSVNPPNVYGFGHQAYYEDVVHCLQSNLKPTIDGQSGRRSLELIHGIYEAVETGREVKWPFVPRHSLLGKTDAST
jgi:UDP-N-acetyl-2-amino-2-deoxyglucuronate dehydrogenase